MNHRRAADAQRRGQRFGDEGQHVRAPIDEALVLTSQVVHMSRSPKRIGRGTNGTGLAGSDTYSRSRPRPPLAPGTPACRRHADTAACCWRNSPCHSCAANPSSGPSGFAGVVDQHRWRIGLRRAIHQVLVEEGRARRGGTAARYRRRTSAHPVRCRCSSPGCRHGPITR